MKILIIPVVDIQITNTYFVNTPLDVLPLGLFDLLAPLALKVAFIDNEVAPEEKKTIGNYLVKEWGYDPVFVDRGLAFIEPKLDEFQKQNPDCNFKSMSKEILNLLPSIIEANDRIDEREEMAIEKVKGIFQGASNINVSKKVKDGARATSDAIWRNFSKDQPKST
ncbi:MAG: hypothetical protein OQK97_09795 [Deltaproteobacteria bacterium]|nr:hypothetical protein [Deltaproteobacteria bacterium]